MTIPPPPSGRLSPQTMAAATANAAQRAGSASRRSHPSASQARAPPRMALIGKAIKPLGKSTSASNTTGPAKRNQRQSSGGARNRPAATLSLARLGSDAAVSGRGGFGRDSTSRPPRFPPLGTARPGDRLDVGLHLAGVLIAPLRLLLQRPQHDFVQAHIDPHLARRRCELAQGQLAGEHFVEDHAQRVDVGPVVHGLGLLDLLGRHVMGRADDLLAFGQRRPSGARGRGSWRCRSRRSSPAPSCRAGCSPA